MFCRIVTKNRVQNTLNFGQYALIIRLSKIKGREEISIIVRFFMVNGNESTNNNYGCNFHVAQEKQMMKKKILQQKIETVRSELDYALEHGKGFEEYYRKSLQLDKLIEKYIDICEEEQNQI